jgi:Flp pilus assembly protein TadG
MMHHRIKKIRNLRRSRRMSWLTRFRRDDRGVQLIELAIVLPIMLLLFAAVAEFGRYFYEYTTVAKGARAGARYLAAKCATGSTTNWQANGKNIVVYGNVAGTGSPILTGLDPVNVDVQYQGNPGVPDTVTVSLINYPHQSVFDLGRLLNNPSLSLNIDIKPSVKMRYLLTQPCV